MTVPYPAFDGTQGCVDVDPELFFPGPGVSNHSADQALAVCNNDCSFKRDCLAYALTHDVHGVWGGTTSATRDEIRRRHGITATRLELSDTHTRQAEIRELDAAGVSQLQIADRLNMPARSVTRILNARKDPA